jgi:hypothetical protein
MDLATHPVDDSRVKLCTVCGVVTSRAGSRCTDHARQSNRSPHNALYGTLPWQRLSARVLRAWRGEHGDRLRTGEPSALGALVDVGTWEHVQAMRARHSRRHRGSVNRRQYGLAGLLACASCGRHLIGHVGRYRHTDACEPFKAAAPRRYQRDGGTLDPRVKGESYKVDLYEAAIGRAFEHVAVSARLKVDTVAAATRPDPDGGDVLALARITRERDRAALRFARDRDLGQLEATMARLDAEAEAAVVRPSRIPTAAEARAYLEELPTLWAKTSDAGRHAIAEATFERIDVLGVTDYTFTLTARAKAHGWDVAFGAGVVRAKEGRSGRGERTRASATRQIRGCAVVMGSMRAPIDLHRSA